jgi:hypothetical protein
VEEAIESTDWMAWVGLASDNKRLFAIMKFFLFEIGLELFFQVAAQAGTPPSAPEARSSSHHASLVIKAVRRARMSFLQTDKVCHPKIAKILSRDFEISLKSVEA